MTTRRLKEMLLKLPGLELPERSEHVVWAQLVEITGITPDIMAEIAELGWIEPARTNTDDYLFTVRDVYRIQKLMRLSHDLEVNITGASIIVDLMARIEELEMEMEKLQRLR